jgi:hypothetical protein
VASYSAVINVSVSGQAALDKLEGSARSIQTLIQGIKQQKDIFNQAVGTEKTRELKKNLENLVNSFALARDGARQFEVTVGGKTQKVNMYSKTLAGLSSQLGTFRAISDNATVGTDRFVNSLIAANKVSNELARTQARAMTAGTGVTGTPKNVQEVLALGKAIPNTIEGLSFYKGKLEELLATLKLTSNEFRAVEEASAAVDVRLGNARLTGQTSKITPAAGPASRIDTVASYEKRAGFAQKVADLEYKQLLTGQQIVKSKLDETQQAELQNRLEQASQALAEGDLALAKRLTNELRNQRIQYERINRDREALMRPTSMVAGASLPVRGGKDIIGSPINLQEGTKAAVSLGQQKLQATGPEKAEASQKRLNNLLNSALIAEQAIIKTAKKGIDVKDEQAQIQSVITKLQQLDVTATKAELSLYDELLNAVRNELKLKKAIAATDAASAKSTKAKAKTQTKTKTKGMGLSDALIGAAFPLLFGQGIGAAAGGGLGGFAGAKIAGGKGGFGGSLAGTLVGQATIDFAINSAVRLGQALQDPTEKIDELIGFLGIAGTELNANIKVLQSLGLTSTASAVALAKLESLLKEEGFKNAEEFSKDLQNLTNAFSRLQLAAANLAGGALPGILDALTNLVKGMSQMPLEPLVPKAKSPADAIKQAQAFNFIGPTADPVATAERVAEEAVTAEMQRQINLATAQKNLEADKLSLTRVDLATRQGAVAIQQVQNELTRKQLELDNARGTAAEKLLGLEVKILQQQEAQAQAAQRNAVIEAERAVRRQIGGLMIEQTELENQIFGLRSQSARLLRGEEVGIASQLHSIEQRYENELGILVVRRDLEKLGINEADVLQEIQTKYDGLTSVLKQRLKNEIETLHQQQAQYKLTQMQIDQQRTLANLETEGRFKQELQRTQSFQDPTGLVPFFGDALINEKLALEDYNTTLGLYNAQLLNLEERMAIPGLNPDVLRGLTQQSDALKDQIALYREYQPAIIQARLEQEKFTTIFNATKTAVDSLADGLVGVVSGTMTAQEAFASFLRTIGEMLAEEGKKMIAKYIAIGIARIFAGMASSGGGAMPGAAPQMTPGAVVTPTGFQGQFAGMAANGATFSNGIAKFARGGVVSSPTLFKFADGGTTRTGLMGEAGPEAIMPLKRGADGKLGVAANLDGAMSRYRRSPGTGGGAAEGGGTVEGGSAAAAGPMVVDVRYSVERINDVEYVTASQFQAGMQQAAQQGAQQGEQRTLRKLQMSNSTRRRVGV